MSQSPSNPPPPAPPTAGGGAPPGPAAIPASPAPASSTVVPINGPAPISAPAPVVSPPKPGGPPAPPQARPPAPAGGRPPVSWARLRFRHKIMILSFLVCVALPSLVAAWYLWFRAADQYASTVGFSVRREEGGSALELLGGLSQFAGSTSSSDTDILYEFLQSQKLVATIDGRLDLATLWSKPSGDPVFAYSGDSIEDLVAYWSRMVRISYDGSSGLIEVRALAFDPDDATRIAQALFDDSAEMINALSAIAREDSIRYARADLDEAVERLKVARQNVAEYRNRNLVVDPRIELQNQSGLMGTLQGQLAAALIELDLLRDVAQAGDPRLTQALRRVEVIEARLAAERAKLGLGDAGQHEAIAGLVGEFERLSVEQEFAERTYVAALASYDAALAESRRKSRYLAAYATPTRAETARFPERGSLWVLFSLFLLLAWSITILVVWALKDRR